MTEKSDRKKRQKKVTLKTLAQYEAILAFMEDDVWYKASEFEDVLGVKETRTKELLRNLVEEGILIDNQITKGRKYKKVIKKSLYS